jgi:hypothetical protein
MPKAHRQLCLLHEDIAYGSYFFSVMAHRRTIFPTGCKNANSGHQFTQNYTISHQVNKVKIIIAKK